MEELGSDLDICAVFIFGTEWGHQWHTDTPRDPGCARLSGDFLGHSGKYFEYLKIKYHTVVGS